MLPPRQNSTTTVSHRHCGLANPRVFLLLLVLTLFAAGCCPCPPSVSPGTQPVLGPADFSGSFDPAPAGIPVFGGKSTFDGAVVFSNLSRSVVQQVLPSDLQLAPNISSTPNVHPVILVLSHHGNMRWLLPGPNPPYENPYEELILLVPFVQRPPGTNWHSLVVRMYLDDFWAIVTGNAFYGYMKQAGTFQRIDMELAPSTFKVSRLGLQMFDATLTSTGHWRSSDNAVATLPNFRDIQTIFSMPLIGRIPSLPPFPLYKCSYFRWDYGVTFVRPMQSVHRFVRPFNGAMGGWVALGDLQSVIDGAVAMRGMNWRIKYPGFSCQF